MTKPSKYPVELRVAVTFDTDERIDRMRKYHKDGPTNARILRRVVAAGLDTLEADVRIEATDLLEALTSGLQSG